MLWKGWRNAALSKEKSTDHETLYQRRSGWSGRNPSLFPMVGNTYTKDYEIDGKKICDEKSWIDSLCDFKG